MCRSICFQPRSICSLCSILFWLPTLLFVWRNPHGPISFPGFSKCTDMLFLLTTKEAFFQGGPQIPPMKAGSCAVKDVLFNLISCHLHVINFSPFISHFLENPDNNHFLSFWRREKCSNV